MSNDRLVATIRALVSNLPREHGRYCTVPRDELLILLDERDRLAAALRDMLDGDGDWTAERIANARAALAGEPKRDR